MSGERGSVTLWLLGWCVAVIFLGGLSLDLWRAFAERRALAGAVDAAAVAGASALDEAAFRADGTVRLNPPAAEAAARAAMRARTDLPALTGFAAEATTEAVRVSADGTVDLTLLRVLSPDTGPLRLRVHAVVEPQASG